MRAIRLLVPIILLGIAATSCEAQGLFGERMLGRAVSKRSSPQSAASAAGSLDSGRRFLREERSVTDFVGSAIAREAAGRFVGGQSAASAPVSSIAGLTEEARPPLNRPRIIRPAGLYAERLTLASDLQIPAHPEPMPPQLSESLQSLIQSRSVTIEVSPEGHSATLRGAVPSEHDRQTTELLVMFEPGIQMVVNDLTVDATLPQIQRRPRFPKSK